MRGGCICMRRESFWARSVILVQTITDKARLIYRPFSPPEVNVPICGMHRGWPRRPTTDSRHRPYRAAICRASGCGKFRDDSYEEACKSRDILGNGWIPGSCFNAYTRIAGSLARYSHGSRFLTSHAITNTFADLTQQSYL